MRADCENVRPLLIPFLDGEVTPRTRLAIEKHLAACPACRNERDALARSWDALGLYEPPKVGEGFTASVMARVREGGADPAPAQAGTGPGRPRRWLRRLAWAAAACLAVGIGVGLHATRRAPDPGPDGREPPDAKVVARTVTEEELIRNLDVYENLDLLQNLELFSDLDVVEKLGEPTS
jgi:anti-sigma factor RsiW